MTLTIDVLVELEKHRRNDLVLQTIRHGRVAAGKDRVVPQTVERRNLIAIPEAVHVEVVQLEEGGEVEAVNVVLGGHLGRSQFKSAGSERADSGKRHPRPGTNYSHAAQQSLRRRQSAPRSRARRGRTRASRGGEQRRSES